MSGQAAALGSLYGKVDPGECRGQATSRAEGRGGQGGGADGAVPVLGPPAGDLCGVFPAQPPPLPPPPHPAGEAAGDPQAAGEGKDPGPAQPQRRGAACCRPRCPPRASRAPRRGPHCAGGGAQGLSAPPGPCVPDPLGGCAPHPRGSSCAPQVLPAGPEHLALGGGSLCGLPLESHWTRPPATGGSPASHEEEGAPAPVAALLLPPPPPPRRQVRTFPPEPLMTRRATVRQSLGREASRRGRRSPRLTQSGGGGCWAEGAWSCLPVLPGHCVL